MAKTNDGIHENHRARMRKKIADHGIDGLEEHEILEVLLYYCIPRRDTNELAHKMLEKYGSLANVFDAPVNELAAEPWLSDVSATLISMIPKFCRAYELSKLKRVATLPTTQDIGEYAMAMFKDKLEEELALICLDANRKVLWDGVIIKGTIDRTEAYPRTVVREALKRNATNVVLVHNHPKGTMTPSSADKKSTQMLVKILEGIGITVLDHIIVNGMRYISMREMGYIF